MGGATAVWKAFDFERIARTFDFRPVVASFTRTGGGATLGPMSDPVRDLESVREATERLLSAVALWDKSTVSEPSRLPGWSRGHVLAHLSRNADALRNVLRGLPMYANGEIRDRDIEAGAPRSLAEHLEDLRTSGELFLAEAAVTADWSRTVELRAA